MQKGKSVRFSVNVRGEGVYSSDVSWGFTRGMRDIDETTIEDGFLYVATTETASTLTVTATSKENPDITGNATVTVIEPLPERIVIEPKSPTVSPGNTLQFTHVVDGDNGVSQEATYSMSGNTSGSTTIDTESGLLTVGSDEDGGNNITVTVTATGKPSVTDSTGVTVLTPPSLLINGKNPLTLNLKSTDDPIELTTSLTTGEITSGSITWPSVQDTVNMVKITSTGYNATLIPNNGDYTIPMWYQTKTYKVTYTPTDGEPLECEINIINSDEMLIDGDPNFKITGNAGGNKTISFSLNKTDGRDKTFWPNISSAWKGDNWANYVSSRYLGGNQLNVSFKSVCPETNNIILNCGVRGSNASGGVLRANKWVFPLIVT